MVLQDPDDGWSGGMRVAGQGRDRDAGGYEVRRRDWKSTIERIRRLTTMYWELRTVYIVSMFYLNVYLQTLLRHSEPGKFATGRADACSDPLVPA